MELLQQLCVGGVALLLGLIMLLAGYRFFLLLLPFWGFFAGFALGGAAVTAIFGGAFLATITGWAVGFIVGLIFAVLSYFVYFFGVAILAGAIGYMMGFALILAFLPGATLFAFIVGIVTALIAAGVTIGFNLQKWLIIVLTSAGGASTVLTALLLFFGRIELADMTIDPIGPVLADSFLWFLAWMVLAVVGILFQAGVWRSHELEQPEGMRAF